MLQSLGWILVGNLFAVRGMGRGRFDGAKIRNVSDMGLWIFRIQSVNFYSLKVVGLISSQIKIFRSDNKTVKR